MGLTSIILSGVGIVTAAVIADLISTEVKGWTPRLAARLIHHACQPLPEGQIRERFLEEWASHVTETPGHLGKLWVAFDATRGAKKIAKAARGADSTWVEKSLDYIAFHGARIVQRSLFKVLKNDLAAKLPPEQTQAVLLLVRSRFEPQLRDILRSKLPRIVNYHQTALEVQSIFASVLFDLSGEVQQRGLAAILGNNERSGLPTGTDNEQPASTN
jgi:hypothetical protein